jgi:phosphoribosyl-ATP pyrophosphohydrolase
MLYFVFEDLVYFLSSEVADLVYFLSSEVADLVYFLSSEVAGHFLLMIHDFLV